MADSRCIVELKETIEKMRVALSQSDSKISELNTKIREQKECLSAAQIEQTRIQEENVRLSKDLKKYKEMFWAVMENSKLAEQKLAEFSQKSKVPAEKIPQIRQNGISDSSSSCSDGSDTDEVVILQNLISDTSTSSSDGSDSNEDMNSDEGISKNNAKVIKLRSGNSKKSSDAALNINKLPEEILIKIFGYLSHNQLGEIARVCTRWNVLTRNPILWVKVDVVFSWHSGSQNVVVECFINRLPPCVTDLILNFWNKDDWTDLLNFEELSVRLEEKCPLLEMLLLENAKLSVNLPSIIDLSTQFLQNLRRLGLRSSSFPHYPAKPEWDDDSKIKVLDLYGCYVTHYNKPPFSRMRHLKKLFLACTDVDDSWFEADTFYLKQLHELDLRDTEISSRTFQILQTHAPNLRKLFLCDTGVDLDEEDDLDFNVSVFPHLKTICLRFNGVTRKGIVSLIQACQSLQNVYADGRVVHSYKKHPFVKLNKCKSKIVKDSCCSYIKKGDYL